MDVVDKTRLFNLYYNASTYESKTLLLLWLIENTDQNENNLHGAHFRYFCKFIEFKLTNLGI